MNRQTYKIVLAVVLPLAGASSIGQAGSAIERFQKLRQDIRKSRADKDWRSNVASARALNEFMNGAPESLLELARAEIHAGQLADALRNAQEFVRTGQSTDLFENSKEFSSLHDQPSFAEIEQAMKSNRTPIGIGAMAFPLSDPKLLAEDLDYDPQAKQFLVTSVRQKKIIATSNGVTRDFATAPDDWPMLAIKIDSARGLVWATEVALREFDFAPKADWGRSAVVCYDANGKLLKKIEGPHGSALGDMALMENGDVIVSDGDGGGVYRLRPKSEAFERLDNGDFVSPQTPAMHPDGKHIFVPDYVRGIGVLDLATKHVQWLSTGGTFALSGIDGLYFDHGKLIAVQNGVSPERVVAFSMNSTLTRIESETIIERSTPTLGDPTHGVMVDGNFYYITNSGWDAIDDHGNIKAGAKLSASRIMRVKEGSLTSPPSGG